MPFEPRPPSCPRPPRLALLLPLLALAACDACGGDPVPFGLDAHVAAPPSPGPQTGARRAPPQILPAGTRGVAVEGATLDLASLGAEALGPDGSLRAVWPLDVDQDGDLDAIALWTDGREARLTFARRDGASFGSPVAIGGALRVPEPAPKPDEPGSEPAVAAACVLEGPEFIELGATRASARFGLSCDDGAASTLTIVDLGRTPRGLLSLTAMGGLIMRSTASLQDADDDEHDDLALTLSLVGPTLAQTSVTLRWLDRPGGLARDPAEPEEALIAGAEAAHRLLRSDAARADAAAQQVLVLSRTLCGGGEGPRLLLGGAPLPCPSSAGAGLALAVRVAALARQGRLAEAALREHELSDPRYRLGPKGRRTLSSAFTAGEAPASLRRRELGEVSDAVDTASRLTTLGFSNSGQLLVRGAAGRSFDLGADPPIAGPLSEDAPPLRSVDGRLGVRDVHRTCRGYVVTLVPASLARPGPSVIPGQDVLIAAAAPPEGVACDPLPDSMLADDGGYRVLGWAPQGLVMARGGALSLLPLTASGQGAGEAMPLAGDAPLPAPLYGAAISADGSRWVEPSAHGVILHQRGREPSERIVSAPAEGEAAPRAVAISRDGERIAYLAGDQLIVLEGF